MWIVVVRGWPILHPYSRTTPQIEAMNSSKFRLKSVRYGSPQLGRTFFLRVGRTGAPSDARRFLSCGGSKPVRLAHQKE